MLDALHPSLQHSNPSCRKGRFRLDIRKGFFLYNKGGEALARLPSEVMDALCLQTPNVRLEGL